MCEFSLWGFRIDVFHSTVFRVCQQARTRAKTNCQIWTRHGRGESAVAVKKFETNRIYITLSLCSSYYVLCVFLSFSFIHILPPSFYLLLSLSICLYISVFSLSLSICLSLSLYVSFFLTLYLQLSPSFFLSFSLSL